MSEELIQQLRERAENNARRANRLAARCNEVEAELAALKAGQGEAVAWRWAWKECREDDGWTYRESPPFDPTTVVVQALYLAPPANGDAVSVHKDFRSVIAMILNALDRDAAEGRAIRGDMAEELRALLAQDQEVKS